MEIVTPFPENHLPKMWKWLQEFSEQMVNDQCPKSYEEMVEKNRKDLEAGAKVYAICDRGIPVGCVWGENAGDEMYAGHLVFERDIFTTAEKLDLARQVLRLMFADGVRKIIWVLFEDNRAFRIFLKKLGAHMEAPCLRDHGRRKGVLVNVSLMASFAEDLQ